MGEGPEKGLAKPVGDSLAAISMCGVEPRDRQSVRKIRQKYVSRGEQYACENRRPEPVPQDVADKRREECEGRKPGGLPVIQFR
jgi:hypothetical protein